MKIVKAVHSAIEQELANEKSLATLETYSIQDFVEKHKRSLSDFAYTTLMIKSMHGFIQSFADEPAIKEIIESTIQRTASSFLQELYEQFKLLEILPIETAQKKYPETHKLSIGTYAQHPYSSRMLTPLEHYHYNLASEKDCEMIVLLGKMGAKIIRIIESKNDNQGQKFTGDLSIAKKIFDAEVNMNFNEVLRWQVYP